MSEQSGPITREQVERAIAGCQRGSLQAVADALGGSWWVKRAPQDVRDAWHGDGSGWGTAQAERLEAALTRWHAELAAAEPVRRVARWDAELEAYALTPIHDDGALMTHAVEDAAKARDWGYEIEGGPEPVRDWKSDRAIVAIWPTPDIGYVPTDRERYPERPAPRFKVGDWVRVVSNGTVYQVGEIATPFGGAAYYFRETGGAENSWQAAALEPASPPAPEVVDVPQPIVKRCGGVEAQWDLGEDHVTLVEPARGVGLPAPLALLRAMLAAIDAQQGGAS